MSPYIMNREHRYWGQNADSSDPQRWLDETGSLAGDQVTKYKFMTFSHGPRACMGQGFARAELSSLIAAIIATFEIKLENPECDATASFSLIVLKPAHGIKVSRRRRSGVLL